MCQFWALYVVIQVWSAVAEMGDHLATIDVGRKLGVVPFLGRGAGSASNTMSPGPRPTFVPSGILIHPTNWPQQIHGPRIGDYAPSGKGELGAHLTECGQGRVLLLCQVSSWSVQPFGHNTPTSQTGLTCDSIGRTVLQTIAQKRHFTFIFGVFQLNLFYRCILSHKPIYGLVKTNGSHVAWNTISGLGLVISLSLTRRSLTQITRAHQEMR